MYLKRSWRSWRCQFWPRGSSDHQLPKNGFQFHLLVIISPGLGRTRNEMLLFFCYFVYLVFSILVSMSFSILNHLLLLSETSQELGWELTTWFMEAPCSSFSPLSPQDLNAKFPLTLIIFLPLIQPLPQSLRWKRIEAFVINNIQKRPTLPQVPIISVECTVFKHRSQLGWLLTCQKWDEMIVQCIQRKFRTNLEGD